MVGGIDDSEHQLLVDFPLNCSFVIRGELWHCNTPTELYNSSEFVPPQRYQRTFGGGRLAPVGVCIHRLLRFSSRPARLSSREHTCRLGGHTAPAQLQESSGGCSETPPAVARHLRWPEMKVEAAVNYAQAFPKEINEAIAENEAIDFRALRRMLPQAAEFNSKKAATKN
jgi:hypothetical protein